MISGTAGSGGDPHVVCLDGSRLDVYDAGYYRLFDNLQETSQSPVIMNAQVIRNPTTHEDIYRQIWIKVLECEYTLDFQGKGVRVKARLAGAKGQISTYEDHGLMTEWQRSYTSQSGEKYTFYCEHAQHTVGLKTGERHEKRSYNGLFSGVITTVGSLHDTLPYYTLRGALTLHNYRYSALLCGSSQPHVITFNRQALLPRGGIYRYLQASGIIVNVKLDETGAMREALVRVRGEYEVKWCWEGEEHWNLTCKRNGERVEGVQPLEVKVEGVMLRVQPNASMSCATDGVEGVAEVRGLVSGEMLVLSELEDMSMIETVAETVVGVMGVEKERPGLYERLIEPVLIW